MSEKKYQDEDLLRELYWEDDLSHSEIAEELGCSRQLITHYFREYGIESRDKSEAVKKGKENRFEWDDEEKFRELYWDEGLSQQEVADELGISRETVKRRFKKYDIDTRSLKEAHRVNGNMGVSHRFDSTGYERIDVSDGTVGYALNVHRLIALIDHTLHELDGMHVHHKNGMKCDNRPENLEVVSPKEHAAKHSRGGL